jgi:predicted transcriptional regulator
MKVQEKLEARKLRQEGYSIKEICQLLGVAKSSVSLWVRDIELRAEQIERLNQKIARSRQLFAYASRCRGANSNKAQAEVRHAEYHRQGFNHAQQDEEFRLICALYWGEGYKSRRDVFGIANCDPSLLRLVLRWLVQQGFGDRVSFSVQYYPDNGLEEEEIRDWWLVNLPELQRAKLRRFTRCVINRASQAKKIGKQLYGTARIEVCCTELVFRVRGGIDYLRGQGDW